MARSTRLRVVTATGRLPVRTLDTVPGETLALFATSLTVGIRKRTSDCHYIKNLLTCQ